MFEWTQDNTWCFTMQLAMKHLKETADDLHRLGLEDLDGVVAKIDRAAIQIQDILSTRYDDCEC